MKARIVLNIALMLATLGMVIVVLGVIAPGLFFPGVYLLGIAMVALAVAGGMYLFGSAETA